MALALISSSPSVNAGTFPCGCGFDGSRSPVPSNFRKVTIFVSNGTPSSSSSQTMLDERVMGE